ncbi:3-deoxy-7-phosphoheptulonate synthase [Rummeliibacillus suwonensis]|uniref:3-deoxy-7-phosphoheptulonate synthase n=1 Tax=Rummeliibacillus suwonensis TaxID=1306154 RepID=UPI001AAF8589|nr:3-deoxy-7-phosphoheptulonate synthase [Rummeliibacillus suwonensis]MBO2535619.1 3-deoxy-7-phosphoheptulonate synthase [Rummeliibacillus suwonensis]
MIIKIENNTNFSTIKSYLESLHLEVHLIHKKNNRYIVISGDERPINMNYLCSIIGNSKIITDFSPYYFSSREFQKEDTIIEVKNFKVGGGNFSYIAGPCTIENENDLIETGRLISKYGATLFRAGAFKPRTSPYNFQGWGREGIKLLHSVGQKLNMPVITEVLNPEDVLWMEPYIDVFQVGTRNMTNTALLKELGKTNKPVLLKRNFAVGIEDWIKAAEFVIVYGNSNVMLCERGIQGVDNYNRFVLDLAAVSAAKQLTHLPVIVDPSHATGRPELIPSMVSAAIVAGADGIIVETHIDPSKMLVPGDGPQALLPHQFNKIVEDNKPLLKLLQKKLCL